MLFFFLHHPGPIGISEGLEDHFVIEKLLDYMVMENLPDYVGTAVPRVNFHHQSHIEVVIWPTEIGFDFLMQWNCLKPHQQRMWHHWDEYLVIPVVTHCQKMRHPPGHEHLATMGCSEWHNGEMVVVVGFLE